MTLAQKVRAMSAHELIRTLIKAVKSSTYPMSRSRFIFVEEGTVYLHPSIMFFCHVANKFPTVEDVQKHMTSVVFGEVTHPRDRIMQWLTADEAPTNEEERFKLIAFKEYGSQALALLTHGRQGVFQYNNFAVRGGLPTITWPKDFSLPLLFVTDAMTIRHYSNLANYNYRKSK